MKKIILPLSSLGASTKSTTLISIASALIARNLKVSKYDSDKKHLTFYRALATKDALGEIEEVQDSFTGCIKLDLDIDATKIADSCADDADFIIVDTAGGNDETIVKSITDPELFINTFFDSDTQPYLLTTYVDDYKSSASLENIINIFSDCDIGDNKINVINVVNMGFIKSKGVPYYNNVMKALKEDEHIAVLKNSDKFNYIEVELKTTLNSITINILKNQNIQQALLNCKEPTTKTLLNSFMKDGNRIIDSL